MDVTLLQPKLRPGSDRGAGPAATVRLLHGTTQAAERAIRACGQLRAQDPRQTAATVERFYGLPAGSVWEPPYNEFSRSRARDQNLYFTQDERTAAAHARCGSETLDDALTCAFRLLHPEHAGRYPRGTFPPAVAFKQAYHQTQRTVPCILELEVPLTALDELECVRRSPCANAAEWVQAATDDGRRPLGNLMLCGPLPAAWVVQVRPVEQTAAL